MNIKNKIGFTLIELLVVIAIIGILGAIAVSMYGKQYIIKARLTEVTESMSVVASAVAAYYQEKDAFPANVPVAMIQDSLGVALPSHVGVRFSDMTVVAGVITATVANIADEVNGRTLILRPTPTADGAITWNWDIASTIQPTYIPKR
jgi:prepilin-type N-terminal cleavage/methylation domain-containing protein